MVVVAKRLQKNGQRPKQKQGPINAKKRHLKMQKSRFLGRM